MVHGKNLRKPVDRVSDVGFCVEIERFLKRNNFRSVYRTQDHCWPHIINGRPVDMLNNGSSPEDIKKQGEITL